MRWYVPDVIDVIMRHMNVMLVRILMVLSSILNDIALTVVILTKEDAKVIRVRYSDLMICLSIKTSSGI